MRPPDRLFEVIDTLNFFVVGHAAAALKIAAIQLRRDGKTTDVIADEVTEVAAWHESPHVRELAVELLALMDSPK